MHKKFDIYISERGPLLPEDRFFGEDRRLFRELVKLNERREERGEDMDDLWALALSGEISDGELYIEIESANLIGKAALSAAIEAIESNPPRTYEVPVAQLESETNELLAFLRKDGHL
jgi:hypothetical protein